MRSTNVLSLLLLLFSLCWF